ncbi:MAG TPA: response regulator, partial [Patescibacteria group bacterium]|nr:response regulator [Patescibacteria group bacterium]
NQQTLMKAKILVVDDSGLARRLLRKILEDLGHEVEDASDGAEALERYALNRHDAIILDLLMHGMYGVEVLEKFKQLNPSLPVIVVSADIQRTTRDQVKAAGAVAMVNKPVTREQLEEVLGIVLKGGTVWN